MNKIKNILAHLSICMSLALMTIAILNNYNPMMAFLSGKVARIYIFIYGITVIATAVISIAERNRR